MDKVLTKIEEIAIKYKEITKIKMFGSRARNDHNPNSDIDLAIFTKSDNFSNKFDFIESIENIDTLLKFDLIFITNTTDYLLKKNIDNEGVVIMIKPTKITNYLKAVQKLEIAVEKCRNTDDEMLLDSLIKRFEFTTELAWKSCKEYLVDMGYTEVNGPKPIMKEAFAHGLVEDSDIWVQILNDRNETSNLYSEKVARDISIKIIEIYLPIFQKLADKYK